MELLRPKVFTKTYNATQRKRHEAKGEPSPSKPPSNHQHSLDQLRWGEGKRVGCFESWQPASHC